MNNSFNGVIEPSTIVSIARSWIGTPYLHQASLKGSGADCLGLIRGIWREAIGPEPAQMPAYTGDWSETGGRELLRVAAFKHCQAVDGVDAQPGDLILFRMRSNAPAKHVGILVEENRFIHAYEASAVMETTLSSF